jgi:zinc transport system permease protein
MRVVGLLLVSAIMIVPVAAAQQVTRSFRATAVLAIVLGLVASLTGLVGSFYVEVPPGPTIVLVALLSFAVLAVIAVPVRRRRREAT